MSPADGKKRKSRIVSFRIDEDDFALLNALARQTSYSRGEVLRRCLTGVQLKSTIDAQALTEVSRADREQLKRKYHLQRSVIAALPVAGRDRNQLRRQLALRQTIETRALKRKLAIQRRAIKKSWHPGTWRHFVARRAAERNARGPERERSGRDLGRGD